MVDLSGTGLLRCPEKKAVKHLCVCVVEFKILHNHVVQQCSYVNMLQNRSLYQQTYHIFVSADTVETVPSVILYV